MVTKPKKRDLLTSKRCPQPPTLLIIFLRKNTQHTHMHTHSHYEKETKPTWGHWVEWSWTTCRSADVWSAFAMYPAGNWDHSKERPHGPRACPHGLSAWWGLWLWTGIHTTQRSQLRGRYRGLGSTEGTSDLALEIGRDLPEELRAKLHHADPSEPVKWRQSGPSLRVVESVLFKITVILANN